jgi:ankyrin repeat protein
MGKLLEAGADPVWIDVDGASALHKAAFNNHVDCAKRLLEGSGAKSRSATSLLNLADRFGSTPLHKAAYNGAVDSLKLMLAMGASVAISDAHGLTPLHLAAYRGQADAVSVLLGSSKCPIDIQTDTTQESALHCAARKGHAACVQKLVDAGANVTARNANGLTPLQLAEQEQHAAVVAILKQHVNSNQMAPVPATAPASSSVGDGGGRMEAVTNVEKDKGEAGDGEPDADDNLNGDGGPPPPAKVSLLFE